MSELQPDRKARKCAVCGKPQSAALAPFCSRRCADLDLGKWLNGSYAIPANELSDDAVDQDSGDPDFE